MLRPHSNAGGRHSRRGLLLTLQGGLATVAQGQERSDSAALGHRALPSLSILKGPPSQPPGGPGLLPLPRTVPEKRQRLPQQVHVKAAECRLMIDGYSCGILCVYT
jgi:hypothetical protein